MDAADEHRAALVGEAVAYVLEHGLTGLSLRPLAAALGTSDRMLLYYFGTKEQLVAEVLLAMSGQLRLVLDLALPPGRVGARALVVAVDDLFTRPELRPALSTSFELVGLAARGREPYASAARTILDEWASWTESRLAGPAAGRRRRAEGVLAAVEGLLLVRAVTANGDRARAGLVALLP